MRWRVTSGAFSYSSKTLRKRDGLTLGFGHRLLAIGFGGLQDLRGAAARFRHHAVGVGLRLVLRTFKIGARGLHVAEGVDHLRRRVDLLQLNLRDLNAGADTGRAIFCISSCTAVSMF